MAQKKNPLQKAKKALRNHKFPEVIKLLEPYVIDYRDSFDFHYMLGTACLYVGDIGGAELYFKKARRIKMIDVDLVTAQAVLYLRRGEIEKAIEYYLEAQDYDQTNKLAENGLNFIRYNNTPEKIQTAIITNKIKKLYPKCGNFLTRKKVIGCSCFILIGMLFAFIIYPKITTVPNNRADLSDLVLTIEDKENSLETDLTTGNYRYILTEKQIKEDYEAAQKYFQEYRDNAAQVKINKILYSNASASIRQKARLLMDYFEVPGFDTIKDNYSYAQIVEDPFLYIDCWVVWSGRVSNVIETEQTYKCDFLVGYEDMKKVDGIVPLVLERPVIINTLQPLTILGKIGIQNGKLILKGNSIYQTINKK
ncbi:MAG: hypothetical protein BKP49_01100 [Treponema sp. CETP13]|nr:MAG: hypothetical protein BKP49_01100 [Treponema sp. CETP13]